MPCRSLEILDLAASRTPALEIPGLCRGVGMSEKFLLCAQAQYHMHRHRSSQTEPECVVGNFDDGENGDIADNTSIVVT